MEAMHWQVEILGDTADLSMLSETFSEPPISIIKRNNKYVFQATDFDKLDAADAARARALDILTSLSVCARLTLDSRTSLRVGCVYRVENGEIRETIVCPEPVTVCTRVLPLTIINMGSDGSNKVPRPADPIARLLPLALTDEAVSKALWLRNSITLSWVELYRVYEVVEDDVGQSTIVAEGWASQKKIDLFTRTANSVSTAGDEARHGKERTQPPKKPMKVSEARRLIDRILKGWLEYKL